MAKQSFVTGQVLTAQQVNDLQTNDFNQTVSAKTASYTLVAADKGTRITMSSTSATTITVNTGLFAAGDTLFIQNLNTGVCTITAGTATVNTSASLALAQHEGGTLYFTSAGVSTFFKAAGATPSSGGLTLLSTTTLAAVSTTISSISGDYTNLLIMGKNIDTAANSNNFIRFNGDTGSNYKNVSFGNFNTTKELNASQTGTSIPGIDARTGGDSGNFLVEIYRYTDTSLIQGNFAFQMQANEGTYFAGYSEFLYKASAAITSITITNGNTQSMTGTVYIYGVK